MRLYIYMYLYVYLYFYLYLYFYFYLYMFVRMNIFGSTCKPAESLGEAKSKVKFIKIYRESIFLLVSLNFIKSELGRPNS